MIIQVANKSAEGHLLLQVILEWITAHWSFTFWKTNLAKGRIISNPALYADGSSCSVNTQLGSR